MDELILSNSKVNTWRRCHRAYHYKYVLKLARKQKGVPLERGSIIHKGLEAYYSGKSWKKVYDRWLANYVENTMEEERALDGDLPGMVKEILENYFYYYDQHDDYDFLTCEYYFELPLIKGVTIRGYIDRIGENDKGKIWPFETKTYKRWPERDFLMYNTQSALYIWVLQQVGWKRVEGMMWDIVKAKKPSTPIITKQAGRLSIRDLDSTPYSFEKFLKEHPQFIGTKEAKHIEGTLSWEGWLKRTPIRLDQVVVNSIMDDFRSTALEIKQKGEDLKDRNLGKDCSWCEYQSLCQSDLMNTDTNFIISREYEKKEDENGDKKESNQTQKELSRKSSR